VPAVRPAPPAPAPQAPSSAAAPAPKTPPDQPRLAAAETAALLARGDSLLEAGDIVSARLFYERASDAGNGRAALRLGATYDPGFLDRIHLSRYADAAQALAWYRRARDLGESDAERWIKELLTKPGG
jgi:TPR repeat protein